MTETVIRQLAEFASETSLEGLPPEVVDDSKRVLLDSIGCALAAVDTHKGSAGVEVGRNIGGSEGPATIWGTAHSSTVFGAAYANGELVNALDFDTVLPPGHVAPYVLPGAVALAESGEVSGKRLLESIAVSHEVSFRIGKAMDYHRTPKDGEMVVPEVLGFTSTIFGATLANSMVLGQDVEGMANALGIAAATTPVNSHRSWIEHVPASTIKYTMAGPVVQGGLVAAFAAQAGHTGDQRLLEDDGFGYGRFIGTGRWEPDVIMAEPGTWGFPAAHSYKPYPHCRVTHGPIDATQEIVAANNLRVEEIDAIRCWGEAWVQVPLWLTSDISHPSKAQMSFPFALAVAAHMLPNGPEWQTEEILNSPTVHALMDKVELAAHPDYVRLLSEDPSVRPTRVEIDARGRTFVAERTHPKGTPSADDSTYMTTDELVAKFRHNASGVLDVDQIDRLVDGLLGLEQVESVRGLVAQTQGSARRGLLHTAIN